MPARHDKTNAVLTVTDIQFDASIKAAPRFVGGEIHGHDGLVTVRGRVDSTRTPDDPIDSFSDGFVEAYERTADLDDEHKIGVHVCTAKIVVFLTDDERERLMELIHAAERRALDAYRRKAWPRVD